MSVMESPVSEEVIERIRRESRVLLSRADELHAELETGRFESSTGIAAKLRRRLQAHLSLVDAVLDAITLDSDPRRGDARRKRMALASDFPTSHPDSGPGVTRFRDGR